MFSYYKNYKYLLSTFPDKTRPLHRNRQCGITFHLHFLHFHLHSFYKDTDICELYAKLKKQ